MSKTHYLWDDLTDTVDRELDDNGETAATYTNRPVLYGKSFSQNRGGEKRYFHFDGQGNTRTLTDDKQTVTDTFAYTPFGEEVQRSGSSLTPYHFQGGYGYQANERFSESYVRRRMYSSTRGRWLAPDPLPFVDGTNSYAFVGNRPTVASDPTGLQTDDAGPGELYAEHYEQVVAYFEAFYRAKLDRIPSFDHVERERVEEEYRQKLAELERLLLTTEFGFHQIRGFCGSLSVAYDPDVSGLSSFSIADLGAISRFVGNSVRPAIEVYALDQVGASLEPGLRTVSRNCKKCCEVLKVGLDITLTLEAAFTGIAEIDGALGTFRAKFSGTAVVEVDADVKVMLGVCVAETCRCPGVLHDSQSSLSIGSEDEPVVIPYTFDLGTINLF